MRPARPIIVIMLMVELSMPMNWLMTAVMPIETRMPRRARMTGTPAATAAPKTMSSTRSAIGRPMASPRERSFSNW